MKYLFYKDIFIIADTYCVHHLAKYLKNMIMQVTLTICRYSKQYAHHYYLVMNVLIIVYFYNYYKKITWLGNTSRGTINKVL